MKTHLNSLRVAACLAASLFLVPAALRADDYTLAAGESATFDNGLTNNYGTLYISGDLTVSGNTRLLGTNATAAVLSGGTVTVEGAKSVFGDQANGNPGYKEMFLNPGADGRYTKITVRNGKAGAVEADYYNVGAKYLTIGVATAETLEQYPDGVFHFLDLDGASANFYKIENNSSLTGLVTIAGSSQFGKGNAYWGDFFSSGNFRVELAQGATFRYNAGNQMGNFNAPGVNVLVTGDGNLVFTSIQNSQSASTIASRPAFNKGAVLDVSGTITFDQSWYSTAVRCWFLFKDSDVFGPSIGKIKSGSNVNYGSAFEVASGVAVRVHDFEFTHARDMVVGPGEIRIDASAAARKFEAPIPTSYSLGENSFQNTITISKYGQYEAEIVATNFPTLKVEEGVARLTRDCVIGCLQGASGAKLIADGCTVTIPGGRHVPNGLELDTANGGRFVKADAGTAYLYGGSALGTNLLHVAGGNVIFSAYGLTQKYFRWTFTKTASDPSPLWLGRLWIFDNEGWHATSGMLNANDNTTASLAANRVCWEYSANTNMALVPGTASWQGLDRSKYVVGVDDLVKNMNNYAKLESPVVDSANPDSWLGLGMRLANDAKPVTGYNVMSEDTSKYPVSWKVEASDDGTTWTVIETRTDVVHAKPGYCNFYDGTYYTNLWETGTPIEYFHFSGYKRDGLEADGTKAVSLQVDEGASVDLTAFTVAPQKIGGLTVDFATSGTTNTCGAIYGGSIAQGGTITVLNAGQSFGLGVPLPITLDGALDAGNLGTWIVMVNGAEMHGRVKLDPDGHPVVTALATVLILR